jgi:hypothetical protein
MYRQPGYNPTPEVDAATKKLTEDIVDLVEVHSGDKNIALNGMISAMATVIRNYSGGDFENALGMLTHSTALMYDALAAELGTLQTVGDRKGKPQ